MLAKFGDRAGGPRIVPVADRIARVGIEYRLYDLGRHRRIVVACKTALHQSVTVVPRYAMSAFQPKSPRAIAASAAADGASPCTA